MPMYFRRCDSCGAKALATATRCPRCEAAFVLTDAHGKRVRLVPCPGCKIVQPSSETQCRWCGTERSMRRFPTRKVAIAATSVAAAIALFVSRDTVTSGIASGLASGLASVTALANTSGAASAVNAATATAPTGTAGASPATGGWNSGATQANGNASNNGAEQNAIPIIAIRTDDGHVIASSGFVAGKSASAVYDAAGDAATSVAKGSGSNSSLALVRDSIQDPIQDPIQQWEEAKALTWVNVRADRSREATVLAIVNPDEIVRLGINAAGWRKVSIDGTTGWVDGRHFAATRQ